MRNVRILVPLTFLTIFVHTASASAPALWRIGASDNDTRGFALAPNKYARFQAVFPEDPVFLVGRSDPRKSWPYCHPGPADLWAGSRQHTFTVLFDLETPPSSDSCRLVVDCADTHAIRPPVLRIALNDCVKICKLPPGGGDASITGNVAAGKEYRLQVVFPSKALRKGLNRLELTTTELSWFLYDSLEFFAPGASLGKVDTLFVRSARLDPLLCLEDGKKVQILTLKLSCYGKPRRVSVFLDGRRVCTLKAPEGISVPEIPLEPVEKPCDSLVSVKCGEKEIFRRLFHRTPSRVRQPADWVDPMLGTSSSRWMLFPGPALPFSMVKLSPDNQDQGWKAGYEYAIKNIAGFSHIHSWTMGGLLTMPTVGPLQTRPGPQNNPDVGYRSRFSHAREKASCGYYSVFLEDYGIKAELTSTTRTGWQRYTFPRSKEARILFDLQFPTEYGFSVLEGMVRKVSPTEIEGYSKQQSGRWASWNEYTVHFVVRFSKPFRAFGGWNGEKIFRDVKEIKGAGDMGAFVEYETEAGETITIKTGISLVSIDQARLNLTTESGPFGWDFDAVRRAAWETWNKLLGKIEVSGGTFTDKVKFYTNLYRSYCARTCWSDVNGKYVDMCEKVRQLPDPASPVYGCDAFWNTFWNLNQLWVLLSPDIAASWVRSLLEIYDRGGWLPKGPTGIEYSSIMVASHEIALIVAAYQAGIRDFDVQKAYSAVKRIQLEQGKPHPCGGHVGNRHLKWYMKYGYVPLERGPVSNTLEYAYDDWCVSQFAKALGKKHDYLCFAKRSENWRNVFDPSVGYVRPRHEDGRWYEKFSPFMGHSYVEGNAWQYTWFVPHNVRGLVDLLGRERFIRRLNEGFERARPTAFNGPTVNHGNQPNMQAAYLFDYAGAPYLTQKWAREIMERYYGTGPYDGYPGDEDQGQMGAWFVMSALGLFQMDGGCSVKPFYVIGSPLFRRAVIHLHPKYYGGGVFTITARGNSKKNIYIQRAFLNGKPLDRPWFYHSEIKPGGELVLEMGPEPNVSWGSDPQDAPPSGCGTD